MLDHIKTIGAGNVTTELPEGLSGPSAGGQPVHPLLTDDFVGPPPTHSFATSIAWSQNNAYSSVMRANPMGMQTNAHGLNVGYTAEATVSKGGYDFPYGADLMIGLADLDVSQTKLAAHGDWSATADWGGQMRATFGEGMPFIYVTRTGEADAIVNLSDKPVNRMETPVDPLTYQLSGLNGAFNGDALKFNVPIDAGDAVAQAMMARVSYDFDGDGKVDRVETYNFLATDPVPGSTEAYTQAVGLKNATGAMADMANGSVKVELWQPLGDGPMSVETNSANSWFGLPFNGLKADGAPVDGRLYLGDGATAGRTSSSLLLAPGATPSTDDTSAPAPVPGEYNGDGEIWYNEGGVVGVTVNGVSYGVFGPTGATWSFTDEGLRSNLAGKDYFSVAVLPDGSLETLMEFRKHAYAFVTDTTSDYVVDKASGTVTTEFHTDVDLKETGGDLSDKPLMALFRHQYIRSDEPLTDWSYNSARGEMKLIADTDFTTKVPVDRLLPVLPVFADEEQASAVRNMVHEELRGLLERDQPFGENHDTYFTARDLAKYADLASLAQQVGYGRARDEFVGAIEKQLESWFTATDGDKDKFYYDEEWGTLIGFPANFYSDTVLNDHHFHYGYMIYAAATVAQFDPEWATQSRYGAMVNELISSVANWDRSNNDYTHLRTFDPYSGFSWAKGDGDGMNQESASESLNFAAAVARWGAVTGQRDIEDLGLYLHSTESEAVAQYWFDVDGKVFPEGFLEKALGVVWSGGGQYGTHFGDMPEWIHGINMVPMNGGSLFYAENIDHILANLKSVMEKADGDPRDWKMAFWMYQALADPDAALNSFLKDPDFQSGAGESSVYTLQWLLSLKTMGTVKLDVTADSPYASAFGKTGDVTYVAYNPGAEPLSVKFSDGKVVELQGHTMVTVLANGTVRTLDYDDRSAPDPTDVPLNLPGDPPEGQLELVKQNGALSLFVDDKTGWAWIKVGDADPIAVKRNGEFVSLTRQEWSLSAIAINDKGLVTVLDSHPQMGVHYAWSVSDKGKYVGETVYGDTNALEGEKLFKTDLNHDGVVQEGTLQEVVRNGKLALIVDTGNGRAYVQLENGKYLGLTRDGWDSVRIDHGGWSLSGIGRDADGNLRVLDSAPGADRAYGWIIDVSGKFAGETIFTGPNLPLGEGIFQKDLDGDGVVAPPPLQKVAINGDLALLVDPTTGLAKIRLENGDLLTVTRDGWGDVVQTRGAYQLFAIGRDDEGRLRVLDGVPGDNKGYGWILDLSGKFVGEELFEGPTLEKGEHIHGVDLNHDGKISGGLLRVVEDAGPASLLVNGNSGDAYIGLSGQAPIKVVRDGWGDGVAVDRGAWHLIAASVDDQGRARVLDVNAHADEIYAWILDADGRFAGEQVFSKQNSVEAETLFHLDLNGDGVIGGTSAANVQEAGAPWSRFHSLHSDPLGLG